MQAVLSTTFILFITILLGFIFGYSKKFDKGGDLVLINFVFYVALPITLFYSCYKAEFSLDDINYSVAYIVSMVVVMLFTYVLNRRLLKRNPEESIMGAMGASQIDGAYFTIPLFIFIFNTPVLAVPLMAIQNIIFFTFSVLMIEVLLSEENHHGAQHIIFVLKRIVTVMFTNPIIISSILGFAAGALHVPLGFQIKKLIVFISGATAPVALFALGISCAYGMKRLLRDSEWLPILAISCIKLLIFPVIALIVGVLFGLPHTLLLALVLFCASPTATHNFIIANHYQVTPEIQTYIVVFTTLLSFVTINLWLYFL